MKPSIEEVDSRREILMVFYANPDGYPPTINVISILAKRYKITLLCRNLGEVTHHYPPDVEIKRSGKRLDEISHRRLGSAAKIKDYFKFIFEAALFSRSRKPALIYAFDMHALIPALLASWIGSRPPIIYHNHDLAGSEVKGFSRLIQVLQYRIARCCSLVVFPESHRAEWFRQKAGLKCSPLVVWNTPMTLKPIPESRLKQKLGSKYQEPVLLYQGRVGPSHGLEALVTAFSKRASGSLVLLGPQWNEEYLRKLYALAGPRREMLFHAGVVPYQEIFSYTAGADIGIALYENTGFNQQNNASASCKIFEYLAAGLPVITSSFPSFREFFDKDYCVWFARPDDPESITAALDDLLESQPQIKELKERARRLHLEKYNYERCFKPVERWIMEKIT